MFHKHKWEETTRRFTAPDRQFRIKGWGTSARDLAEKALSGYTTIEQRCQDCGKLQFYTVYGDQT